MKQSYRKWAFLVGVALSLSINVANAIGLHSSIPQAGN